MSSHWLLWTTLHIKGERLPCTVLIMYSFVSLHAANTSSQCEGHMQGPRPCAQEESKSIFPINNFYEALQHLVEFLFYIHKFPTISLFPVFVYSCVFCSVLSFIDLQMGLNINGFTAFSILQKCKSSLMSTITAKHWKTAVWVRFYCLVRSDCKHTRERLTLFPSLSVIPWRQKHRMNLAFNSFGKCCIFKNI